MDRRQLLKTGLCSGLLPGLLPGLLAAERGEPAPKRLLYVYVPNGVWLPDFRPTQTGELSALAATLEPLAPYRSRLSVLSGLTQDRARPNGDGPGDHARAAASFLTGMQAFKTDGQVRLGPSADQLVAAALRKQTPFESLALGLESALTSGECDSGYACAYSSHISWRDALRPAPRESEPRLVFDLLFRAGAGALTERARRERDHRRRDLMSLLWSQSRSFVRGLPTGEATRMEGYLQALSTFEQRLHGEHDPEPKVPDSARPEEHQVDYAQRAADLFEIIAWAFATDTTRVVTLMLGNEGSNRSYPNLGESEGHHSLSHYGQDADKQARIARINRYHVELFAGLLARLEAFPSGAGTLLDQVHIVYGSGIADGNRHDHGDLPILLAGARQSSFEALPLGRHLVFPQETPLNDLHLALLAEFAVRPEAFGDGRGPLDWSLAQGV